MQRCLHSNVLPWLALSTPSHFAGCRPICHPARPSIIKPACLSHIRSAKATSASATPSNANESSNTLELLRECSSPIQRAALLQQLDGKWRESYATYQASEVEKYLSETLGIIPYNVMMLAVQNPTLSTLDVDTQVKPAVAILKSFQIDIPDIWHLAEKKLFVFKEPATLQRWLDFLSVYGLRYSDLTKFLLRVSQTMYFEVTIHQAGQAIQFVKSIGVTDEYLASRILPLWPAVISQSVDAQLRPTVLCLMQQGLTMSEVLEVVVKWPEILTVNIDAELKRYIAYLKTLGSTAMECGSIIKSAPHLVQFEPEQLFRPKLQLLQQVGVSQEQIAEMIHKDTGFLTVTGGFDEQMEALKGNLGLSNDDIHDLLLGCPQVLCQPPAEITRNWQFYIEELGASTSDILLQPTLLAKNIMHEFGPRHAFLKERGKLDLLSPLGLLDISILLLSDHQFCSTTGTSPNEFAFFKNSWENAFVRQLNMESERIFRDALGGL